MAFLIFGHDHHGMYSLSQIDHHKKEKHLISWVCVQQGASTIFLQSYALYRLCFARVHEEHRRVVLPSKRGNVRSQFVRAKNSFMSLAHVYSEIWGVANEARRTQRYVERLSWRIVQVHVSRAIVDRDVKEHETSCSWAY